jgi:hypothetical protein
VAFSSVAAPASAVLDFATVPPNSRILASVQGTVVRPTIGWAAGAYVARARHGSKSHRGAVRNEAE